MKKAVVVLILLLLGSLLLVWLGRSTSSSRRSADAMPPVALPPGDLAADSEGMAQGPGDVDALEQREELSSEELAAPPELDAPYSKLYSSFPSLEVVRQAIPSPLPKPPASTPYVQQTSDEGPRVFWTGSFDAEGNRHGQWIRWNENGVAASIVHYQYGKIVPPAISLHPNGSVRAYHSSLDEMGRSDGVAWRWYPDGRPEAAITWKENVQDGPALFLLPDGSVDNVRTKYYSGN